MTWRFSLLALLLTFSSLGCSGGIFNQKLPLSSSLGNPGGRRIARTIVHLHTPWSYDACDAKGFVNDTINESCLQNLRRALCFNHIDFAFLSDHPSHMRERTFEELVLKRGGDTLLTSGASVIGNQMEDCGDGQRPILLPGFEGQLMGLAMRAHLSTTSAYDASTAATASEIKTTGQGIAVVPHTEKWSVSDLTALGMDGIEVYNLHAQLDPKIRNEFFTDEPFAPSMNLLPYWLDSFQIEQPDLAFLASGDRSSVYDQKWGALLKAGINVFGVAATDSHENFFASPARDGDRVDSHRRIIRWLSNHLLVSALTETEAKAALAAKRFWMVFEALGTPVGMDFSATVSSTRVDVGGSQTFVSGNSRIDIALPTLHTDSPQTGLVPTIRLELTKLSTTGTFDKVAETTGAALQYTVTAAGIYRASVYIKPLHLTEYLTFDRTQASQEKLWILTNPIWLN